MSVGRLEEIEAPDPGHEPWLSHTDRLPFPVEWSAQFDVLSGVEARKAIQRKLLVVRDMQRHYREHDLDEPLALDRQARQAREVEDQMTPRCRGGGCPGARLVPARGRRRGPRRSASSGSARSRPPTAAGGSASSTRKGQYGLLREFIPGEPVSTSAYRRRLPVLYVAAGVPTASSQAGRPARPLRRLHRRRRRAARSCSTPTTPPR